MSQIPKDNIERFFYWMQERYQIHHLRQQGCPKPWTNDPVLQSVFFTCPYREDDKTTAWFRENIRQPLRDDQEVLFAILAFRLFNYIPTGKALLGESVASLHDRKADLSLPIKKPNLFTHWNKKGANDALWAQQDRHGKVFTGAYIIKLYNGVAKIDAACDILELIWQDREQLYDDLLNQTSKFGTRWGEPRSMQFACNRIMQYPQMGPFMSYEVVCDLRYTHVLEDAPDKLTWANLGPGANRGLWRLFPYKGVSLDRGATPNYPQALAKMRELLRLAPEYLPKAGWTTQKGTIAAWGPSVYKIPKMPALEMREIEHSLCEFDKYERARLGDGSLKRMYDGR
jgi:hypothetical protein